MPLELLDALSVVLLNELLALVLVVQEHNALEECVRPCELANLLLAVLANVEEELEVRVGLELWLERLSNLVTELFLALNLVLTEHLVEEVLIDLCLLVAADLCDLIAEVRLELLSYLAVDLEESRDLCFAFRISLARVECDDVAELSTLEEILLLVNLDV